MGLGMPPRLPDFQENIMFSAMQAREAKQERKTLSVDQQITLFMDKVFTKFSSDYANRRTEMSNTMKLQNLSNETVHQVFANTVENFDLSKLPPLPPTPMEAQSTTPPPSHEAPAPSSETPTPTRSSVHTQRQKLHDLYKTVRGRPTEAHINYFSWDQKHQVGIVVRQGNICNSSAQMIVNAANQDLREGGGISGMIHQAAGAGLTKIQVEKEKWKKENDKKEMEVGKDSVLTSSGDLIKNGVGFILHVAGPDVREKSGKIDQQQHWDTMLAETYGMIFKAIENYADVNESKGPSRIAIPVISGKIFGLPPEKSLPIVMAARDKFIQERSPDAKPIVLEFYTYSKEDTEKYVSTFSEGSAHPNLLTSKKPQAS